VLTRLDESLLHQAPRTFADATTSDHRFYDRCWVAAYDPAGGTALNMGVGLYKNMNVLDGFCCLVRGDHQRNVRVSRRLRPDLDRLGAGPLHYEVVEPYRHVRIELDPGAYGLSCRLDWRSELEPFLESPTFTEVNGRTATDVQRYDQTGRVDGWIASGEERIAVDGWFGARDHSWGVRGGVGGFEPASGPSPFSSGFLITWLLFATDELCGYVQLNRDGVGNVVFLDGRLRWRSNRPDRRVEAVEQSIDFPSGSRWYRRASMRIIDTDGDSHEVECERLASPIVMHGGGYDGGYLDGQGLGVPRGDHVVEWDDYDLSIEGTPTAVSDGARIAGTQTEQPVSVVFDGVSGVGDFTVLPIGDLARYGVPPAES
jgi:hypothetical protein